MPAIVAVVRMMPGLIRGMGMASEDRYYQAAIAISPAAKAIRCAVKNAPVFAGKYTHLLDSPHVSGIIEVNDMCENHEKLERLCGGSR